MTKMDAITVIPGGSEIQRCTCSMQIPLLRHFFDLALVPVDEPLNETLSIADFIMGSDGQKDEQSKGKKTPLNPE